MHMFTSYQGSKYDLHNLDNIDPETEGVTILNMCNLCSFGFHRPDHMYSRLTHTAYLIYRIFVWEVSA